MKTESFSKGSFNFTTIEYLQNKINGIKKKIKKIEKLQKIR